MHLSIFERKGQRYMYMRLYSFFPELLFAPVTDKIR